jgi:hypothetical protein
VDLPDSAPPLNTRVMMLSAIVLRTLRAARSFFSSDLAAGGVEEGDISATTV